MAYLEKIRDITRWEEEEEKEKGRVEGERERERDSLMAKMLQQEQLEKSDRVRRVITLR